MVTRGERALIIWLVKLSVWKMQRDQLWGRAFFTPMWGTRWLLRWIMQRQVVDDLHHAPLCPSNHWCRQALVFQRCNCGADRHAHESTASQRD
jgi:hypothetical protein